MDVIQLVRKAQEDSLYIHVLPNGNLKVAGHELICEKWLEQIQAYKSHIVPLLSHGIQEFEDLYRFIAPLAKWNDKDYQAWLNDYVTTPDEVLRCLRALRCSWKEGFCQSAIVPVLKTKLCKIPLLKISESGG